MLELGGESFVVRMQWSGVRSGQHVVGCEFIRARDAVRAQELMGLSSSAQQSKVQPLLGASAVTLVGTIIVGLIVFLNGQDWPFQVCSRIVLGTLVSGFWGRGPAVWTKWPADTASFCLRTHVVVGIGERAGYNR